MDVDLHDELLRMAAQDQAVRRRLGRHARLAAGVPAAEQTPEERQDLAWAREIDARNLVRIRAIVRRRGWPGRSMVGGDGAAAAWLLVQHASADRAFQRACLTLLQAAVRAGEAPPMHLAYLTDRLLLADGLRQRYGTQLELVDGVWQPAPLEDPERVDDRRRALGMEPLDAYRRLFD